MKKKIISMKQTSKAKLKDNAFGEGKKNEVIRTADGLLFHYTAKYFKFSELLKTRHPYPNIPTYAECQRLQYLVSALLDPLREAYGKPIVVSSGFRSEKVNKAAGGVRNSQHRRGEAADLQVGSIEANKQLFELIKNNFKFDQLIDEYGMQWVHVSLMKDGINRHERLRVTFINGEKVYQRI